jgi:peptide/nickel transport system substrate-binding protein
MNSKNSTALAAVLCAVASAFLAANPEFAGAQTHGGTAVVAVPADPGQLNPGINTGYHVHIVADSMFNGLVALDRSMVPVPDLAESWTVNSNATEYVFKLQRGAKWHDGKPLTSADVKYSFEEVLFKHHARTRGGLGNIAAGIDTPDDHTVVIRLRQPYGALLQALDVTEAPILPRHIYAGTDPTTNPANRRPIGTGPFKFDSYQPDQSVTLVRNSDYFKPGLPYLDRLIFRIIPDATTQTSALLRGEVDVIDRVNLADIERLVGRNDIKLERSSSGAGGGNCIMTLSFNLERPALADPRVRRAIAHAINRQQILDQVIFGEGAVASAPISSGIGWAHAAGTLDRNPYAPEKAIALLDEAGVKPGPNGVRLSLDILHFPTFNKYSEVMRPQLARAGIRLNVRPHDRAAFVEAVFAKRDFDLNIISYCNGADPEIGVRRMYMSTNIGNIAFSNAAAYRNARVDALFAAAGATADIDTRRQAYREIQGIVAEELPYWWLVETVGTVAFRAGVTGLAPWTGQFAERASVTK